MHTEKILDANTYKVVVVVFGRTNHRQINFLKLFFYIPLSYRLIFRHHLFSKRKFPKFRFKKPIDLYNKQSSNASSTLIRIYYIPLEKAHTTRYL